MLRMRRPARRLAGCTGIAVLFAAALTVATSGAEARPRRGGDNGNWRSGTASIVVDVKTGRVLEEQSADAARHPASLTKIMTLYLLFEQLEVGKLKLDAELKASARAERAAPSKLGLDEDDTISVEDAIKALVTRSANDVAVTIAEAIGGNEEAFAVLMTRKARALGMKNTVFRNASGLPDSEQITTARDLALLGRAIQDRFPRYYRYFSIRTFNYDGEWIRNHNRLLGTVDGVDGIKTGFTRASGFNLVTNVRTEDRHIVAVVLGGRTGGERDARMRQLIARYLPRAFAGNRTVPRVVEASPAPAKTTVAAAPAPRPRPEPGSNGPIRPTPVKTVTIGKLSGIPEQPKHEEAASALAYSTFAAVGAMPLQQLQPMQSTPVTPQFAATPQPVAVPQPAPVVQTAPVPVPTPVRQAVASPRETIAAAVPTTRGGWLIQIGAFPEERQARETIESARERAARVLANAEPFTEKTRKGSTDLFRARFAGFDENGARRACDALKRNDFPCVVMRN
jgi:D-alanyl-D-alanine carboxypeptidase